MRASSPTPAPTHAVLSSLTYNSVLETINTLIEIKGKFQITLIILLCLNSISVGINHTITTFHIYVPTYFCQDDPYQKCGVFINGTECPSGFVFDENDGRSLVVEWSLVCERRMLAPLVNTIYFIGVTLGALVCSSLCDVWGRKKLVLLCLYAQVLMAIGQFFSSTLILFSIFRMLQGFFIQGLQTCSYTLILEYCPSKYRTIAAMFWELNWAVGLALLSVASYFIRDWRFLTMVMTLPAVLSLSYSWIIPESITWLVANGKKKEAIKLVKRVAAFNDSFEIVQQCDSFDMDEFDCERAYGSKSKKEDDYGFLNIFRNSILRKHLFSMIDIWFSVTLSYYGILYFLPNLAGERHLNFFIGAIVEIIAYVITYYTLLKIGRRIPMVFYQYANGVLLLLIGIISNFSEESSAKVWFQIIIALMAKGLAVSSFCGMFIYCSELLPTVNRGLGLGVCGFSARVGSLLAPQLMALVYYVPAFIPLSVMAGLLFKSGTVTIFLPETLLSRLPNTIAEANEMWEKKH